MSSKNEPLFRPLVAGALELPNRVVMAPLTRARANPSDRVPTDMMAQYYSQRAGAGLIVSEATAISEEGYGWQGAPAMYNSAQVEGWKKVTDAVHQAGGRIVLQLWHMGRVSHPDYQNGRPPVGPSAIAAEGFAHTPTGKQPYVTPRELTRDDISRIVGDYAAAAKRAWEAGFDGVEIHGANSYLIDEFLRDASNQRQDEYGGSIENRVRFLREAVAAVTSAWSADRTGLRLSPTMNGNGMSDADPVALFTHVAEVLNGYGLAYLHTAEAIRPGRLFNAEVPRVTPHIRKAYKGVLIANGGFEKSDANAAIEKGEADAIAFGQSFIANPDLPLRLKLDAPLNEPILATYYSPGPVGYIDYPSLESASAVR